MIYLTIILVIAVIFVGKITYSHYNRKRKTKTDVDEWEKQKQILIRHLKREDDNKCPTCYKEIKRYKGTENTVVEYCNECGYRNINFKNK